MPVSMKGIEVDFVLEFPILLSDPLPCGFDNQNQRHLETWGCGARH